MCARRLKSKFKFRADRDVSSLPALASLTELPSFTDLVATSVQLDAFKEQAELEAQSQGVSVDEFCLAAVVRLDRGYPALLSADEVFRAEFSAALSKSKTSVAVGDWVVARRPSDHEKALICSVLPRTTEVARWRGRARGERQVLAANVSSVLIAQPLGERDLAVDRIARSVVVALDCRCEAIVVLTKADLLDAHELADVLSILKEALSSQTKIVVTSAQAEVFDSSAHKTAVLESNCLWGIEALKELVPEQSCSMLLGESGAGKSTLLNALLGCDALETGAVRAKDAQGRHTTVARRMVKIAEAGIIIDEPGLRSLPLLGHERGLALAYPEISHAAQACKFRDCTHTHEPGCEVRSAFEAQEFSQVRLDTYLRLASEMRDSQASLDPDIAL